MGAELSFFFFHSASFLLFVFFSFSSVSSVSFFWLFFLRYPSFIFIF